MLMCLCLRVCYQDTSANPTELNPVPVSSPVVGVLVVFPFSLFMGHIRLSLSVLFHPAGGFAEPFQGAIYRVNSLGRPVKLCPGKQRFGTMELYLRNTGSVK